MHQYLQEIGIKSDQLPTNWFKKDKRQEDWKKQRKKYGFDERELWSFDVTYSMWLYERLKMFESSCPQELLLHKIKYKDKEYTIEECLSFIIKALNNYLKEPLSDYNKKVQQDIEKAHALLGKIIHYLWW